MIAAARDSQLSPSVSQLPVVRLRCHAPNTRDPRRRGEPCGGLCGAQPVPGTVEFVTTAKRLPDHIDPDGTIWAPCVKCGTWNRFRLVPVAGAA